MALYKEYFAGQIYEILLFSSDQKTIIGFDSGKLEKGEIRKSFRNTVKDHERYVLGRYGHLIEDDRKDNHKKMVSQD